MTIGRGIWLQCATPQPRPRARLICFPHAGGSASYFRGWGSHLPGIEVLGVCYPGRAERCDEPSPTDLLVLAQGIANAVESMAGDCPLAMFGHSMGAPLALETARLLEARGARLEHLFASGSRDGDIPARDTADHVTQDLDAVMATLVRMGGTDPELAADPDFRELVLPYVLGDELMFNAYSMKPGPLLRCPVTTIVGDCDVDADRRPWSTLTSGRFRELTVQGDHFYLAAHPPYAILMDL